MRKSVTITVERRKDGRIAGYFQSGSEPRETFLRCEPDIWRAGYGCLLHKEYAKVLEDLLSQAREASDEA
jgi:hypothetical protein|tara:strand:- start:58 stop:267 length:210 start_codon:yes stop_codon:yes gene_type:complete